MTRRAALRLAPGVLEGPEKRVRIAWLRRHRQSVLLVLVVILGLAAMSWVLGFGLGYLGAHRG